MSDAKRFIRRNFFMLKGTYARRGYDWWWHSFTGFNKITGEEKTFFIEYYVVNPALYPNKVVLGQRSDNLLYGIRPSYVMIKAGSWGKNAKQIHNFYPTMELVSKRGKLNFQIGSCTLTETELSGSVSVAKEEAVRYPECMTDAGSMTWNLSVSKKIPFCAGYGTSWLFRAFHIFEMYWHAQGVKTEYTGTVTLDGSVYDIVPDKSFGYADKNWGTDYTNPWLWLSSCDLTSLFNGKQLYNSCFVVGGGTPKVFGFPLRKKLLVYLKVNNTEYEFNFSHFWKKSTTTYTFYDEGEDVHWIVSAESSQYVLDISVFCNKSDMIKINYESPNGQKQHENLWNGGTGRGEIKLFKKVNNHDLEILENISIAHVGCEYGEYITTS